MKGISFLIKKGVRKDFALSLLLSLGAFIPETFSQTPVPVTAENRILLTVDLGQTYQQIDNFGASDAWSTQFIGHWPDEKKNAMADLLFSVEKDAQGKPKGIGLSLWRFNIGAGSAENTFIKDEWRRAESFLQPDGSYDWSKQSGQRWFLRAAKERGVDQFLAFVNSPPLTMTKNGKAFASHGQVNLSPERYDEFSDFITQVLKGVSAEDGIEFEYISPINEPQWDWSDGKQEGAPYANSEISGVVKSLNSALESANMKTQIIVPETAQYEFLFSDHGKPTYGKQIQDLFTPTSTLRVDDLSHVAPIVAAHSYFTTSPQKKAVGIRKQVADAVAGVPGLRFWQSEYCVLGDNAGEIEGNGRDLGINTALYVAKTIHNDLTVANASAWQWWLAVSPYNYKDGLLYVDYQKSDGEFYESKTLWAMGNYSHFIRPGAVRVAVKADVGKDAMQPFVSSYRHGDSLVTVLVNTGPQALEVEITENNGRLSSITQAYRTSDEEDLTPLNLGKEHRSLWVKPRSITTVIQTITD